MVGLSVISSPCYAINLGTRDSHQLAYSPQFTLTRVKQVTPDDIAG
jgi:hypothetical protein